MTAALPDPAPALRACVVVPARDEEERIVACLAALDGQVGLDPAAYEIVLVLDRSVDETRARALRFAGAARAALHVVDSAAPGAGGARRTGMDLAFGRLSAVGRRARGLIACTDADTRAEPGWLRAQLDAVEWGARAIGGRIELDANEALRLAPGVLEARERSVGERLRAARRDTAGPALVEHWNFSGASMAVTAEAYAVAGRIEPLPTLEDESFERALRARGVPIERPGNVAVTTSARRDGRAPRGLAHDLALADRRARAG